MKFYEKIYDYVIKKEFRKINIYLLKFIGYLLYIGYCVRWQMDGGKYKIQYLLFWNLWKGRLFVMVSYCVGFWENIKMKICGFCCQGIYDLKDKLGK